MWLEVKDTLVIGGRAICMAAYVTCIARCQTSSCEILGFKQIFFFSSTVSSIVPSIYLYPTAETVSVNGSSQDGRCSS